MLTQINNIFLKNHFTLFSLITYFWWWALYNQVNFRNIQATGSYIGCNQNLKHTISKAF